MKFAKTLLAMLLIAVLAMTMTGFAFAEGAIKIGFIGPLQGAAADYGISANNGAQIAVDEINALGGLQIEYNPMDDEHDQEKSVFCFNQLYDWKAQMIVGCVTTNPCLAVSAEAYERRVFMLTPSASSTDVTAGKDNVYQMCFTDPSMGIGSANYIHEHRPDAKIAVIYNNSDVYSTGIYQTFSATATDLGLNIVSVTPFSSETDYTVQLTKAKEAEADLVFMPIYYDPASLILSQADAMNYHPTFFGTDGMDGILTSVEGFDTSLAEGLMLMTPFSPADEKSQAFVAEYQSRFGNEPSQFAADGYDCIYALYEAIKAAGITPDTPREECCDLLIDAFQNMTFSGLTGDTMTWDATGTVTKDPTAVIVKDGKYANPED